MFCDKIIERTIADVRRLKEHFIFNFNIPHKTHTKLKIIGVFSIVSTSLFHNFFRIVEKWEIINLNAIIEWKIASIKVQIVKFVF